MGEHSKNNELTHIPHQTTQTYGIQRRNINEHLLQHNTQSISTQRTTFRISKYSSKKRNEKTTTQIFQHKRDNIGKSFGNVQNRTNCHLSRPSMCKRIRKNLKRPTTHPISHKNKQLKVTKIQEALNTPQQLLEQKHDRKLQNMIEHTRTAAYKKH